MNKSAVSLEHRLVICQQVANLVHAKLPISGQLSKALSDRSNSIKELGETIDQNVLDGKSWSDALIADGSSESQVLAACIEAGEASECLDVSLQSWAGMHIANAKAQKTLYSALLYPILLILVTIVSLSCVAYALIPKYRETYQTFQHEMPLWLELIVQVRENTIAMVAFIAISTILPLLVFFWLRRKTRRGQRDKLARGIRHQALATEMASLMTGAAVPLHSVTDIASRVAGAAKEEAAETWEKIQNKETTSTLPRESSMLLGSAHAGVLTPEETSAYLAEVAQNLNRSANLLDAAHTRWLPMLVALSVGSVTILTYVFLIFLPWIWLLQKIADPVLTY